MTVRRCIWVKVPGGERVQCEVLETTYSPLTLLEMAKVRAISGFPFNGQRIAVVPMSGNISAVNVPEKKETS